MSEVGRAALPGAALPCTAAAAVQLYCPVSRLLALPAQPVPDRPPPSAHRTSRPAAAAVSPHPHSDSPAQGGLQGGEAGARSAAPGSPLPAGS